MIDAEDLRQTILAVKAGLIGAAGGMVGYLVDVVHRGRVFRWGELALFVAVAFFLGQVIQDVWPISDDGKPWPGMGGTIAICGSSGYVIFTTMQDGSVKILKRAIDAVTERLK